MFPQPIPQILLKHKAVSLIPKSENHLILRLGSPSLAKNILAFFTTKNTWVLCDVWEILIKLMLVHAYVGHPVWVCFVGALCVLFTVNTTHGAGCEILIENLQHFRFLFVFLMLVPNI